MYFLELIDNKKLFLLRLFKMAANQTGCSRIEKKSAIKYLIDEKNKLSEIYRRMYDMYGEACLSQKDYYKCAKHGFATLNMHW